MQTSSQSNDPSYFPYRSDELNPSNKPSINDESRDQIGDIPMFTSSQPVIHSVGQSNQFNWSSSSTPPYRDFSVLSTAEPSPHGSNQSSNQSNNASAVTSPSSISQSLNSRTQSLSFSGSATDSRRASESSAPLTQSTNMQNNTTSPHQSSPSHVKDESSISHTQQQQQYSDNDDDQDDDQSVADSADRHTHSRSRRRSVSPNNVSSDRGPSCVIECGRLNDDGERIYHENCAYFNNQSVEVYQATNDPRKRTLYRAAQLSEKFNCATNKVGMYLARRRNQIVNSHAENPGLYQATSFRAKPSGRSGLKAGGYFVSIEVCRAFQNHYETQLQRKKKASQNAGIVDPSSAAHAQIIQPQQRAPQQQQYAGQGPFSSPFNPSGAQQASVPSTAADFGAQPMNPSLSQLSSNPPVRNTEQADLIARLHVLQQLQQQQQHQHQLQQQQGMMQNPHAMNQQNGVLMNQLFNNQPNPQSVTQLLSDSIRINPNFYNQSLLNQAISQQYSANPPNQSVNQYGSNNAGWNQYPPPNQSMNQYPTDPQSSNQYLLSQQANQYSSNNQSMSNPSTSLQPPVKPTVPNLAVLPLQNPSPSFGPASLSNQLAMGPMLTPINQSLQSVMNQPNQSANQQSRSSAFSFSPPLGAGANPVNNPINGQYQPNYPSNSQYHNGMFYPPNNNASQVNNTTNNQFARFASDGVSPSHVSPVPYNTTTQPAQRQTNPQSMPSRPPSSTQFRTFNAFM